MINEMNLLDGSERFTLTRVQLVNWGTFSGIHDIPVSSKGHLFVGGSGSGKSTILDAMSSLLSSRASYFNAAARQGEKKSDRSFVSYIRGAWASEQDKDGKAASKFLREGPTFSAVSMTFTNNFGTEVTLLFIGFILGKSREEANVRKRYFVISEPFEMMKLKDFGRQGFDVRLVSQRFPTAKGFKTFSSFAESFMKIFSIRSIKVLDLLHKAQSAKNMGDINRFFRDFMLAEPQTFSLADNLVENFSRLREAYEVVKTSRRQLEVLSSAKKSFEKAEAAENEMERLNALKNEIEGWTLTLKKGFIAEELPKLQKLCFEAEQFLTQSRSREEELSRQLDELKRRRYESGGGAIERLEEDKRNTSQKLELIQRNVSKLAPSFEALKMPKPRGLSQWVNLIQELKHELSQVREKVSSLETKEENLAYELRVDEDKFKELDKEIDAMERHPSNIPSNLLKVRDTIIKELDLRPEDLPFVGELMEIKDSEAQWQGAAERVLHQFASSLLVKERNYGVLARFVDKTYLGTKLVYHRVANRVPEPKELSRDSLPEKFELKQGEWSKWLRSQLSQRFDYECVESTAEFSAYKKAVSLAGQVKHNESRHEKDDRRSINDRRYWITGFSNEKKLEEFKRLAQELASTITQKQTSKRKVQQEQSGLLSRQKACERIIETEWQDIDEATYKSRLAKINEELKAKEEANDLLKQLTEQIQVSEDELVKTRQKTLDLSGVKAKRDLKLSELSAEMEETDRSLSKMTVHSEVYPELTRCYNEHSERPLRKGDLDSAARYLSGFYFKQSQDQYEIKVDSESQVQNQFSFFITEWPVESSELDNSLRSAPEFFKKLESLETDGLPKFEHKFRDILENSTKQNLVHLVQEIDDERRDIKFRMKEVNESLSDAVFNRYPDGDTYLIIDVKELRLPEFEEFRKEHEQILRTNTEKISQADAEIYYRRLEALVKKIDGQDPDSFRWRSKVLDAREHVVFQGREVNNPGETVDIYDSGLGKSGGQRQKLTLTCLVAALRYQLGSHKNDLPSFAPIVMDEAFDKADSEFTDISLRIFNDFGFQPIIATPLKGLLTLEPYMGSFAYVNCEARRASSVMPIQLKKLKEMLRGEAE
ncbi:ATP-binding protein [uncultured Turicimonas sp.]|uniref:ATP-binding protein n=1 Tax=uncultured Turicimonas sp. TaxID=1918607 RepID=UPI00321195D0